MIRLRLAMVRIAGYRRHTAVGVHCIDESCRSELKDRDQRGIVSNCCWIERTVNVRSMRVLIVLVRIK